MRFSELSYGIEPQFRSVTRTADAHHSLNSDLTREPCNPAADVM